MANRYTLTEQQKVIDTYLKGCVNLYGFVTPRQFLKVYNRYNTPKIRKDDLLKCGMKLIRCSYDSYYIYTNAIVSKRVPDEKMAEIAYFQQGKKYYTPTRDEILKYADPNYSQENEYTKALCDFFVDDMDVSLVIAKAVVKQLEWLVRTEQPFSEQLHLVESHGIEPEDIKQGNEMISLMTDMHNNCRKWANCGYTPSELFVQNGNK